MELPWMSVASARAELESDSSSLLRSIYGSQVSQVLLVSDDSNTSLFNEGTWAQERTGRRFVRPKSSPALTRSEKENQQSSLKSQTNLAPYSAPRTTRALQRPATARVSERGGAGRPISARSHLLLEDVEKEVDELPRASIQHTKPVALTRIPEYLNFWQGKPLSKREYSIPAHARTAQKRPKSDYGSRIMAPKGREKSLAMVSEVEDSTLGLWRSSTDERADINKTVSSIGKDSNLPTGWSKQGLRRDGRGSDSKWRNDTGKDVEQDSRIGSRPETGTSAVSVWAQRSQRRKARDGAKTSTTSSDKDDFFHKNMALHSSWLQVGGSGTKRTRFELPMDLKLLEQMTPLQYLKAHCIVSNYHMSMCSRTFTKFDKDKDAHLSQQEVVLALQDALHGCLSLAKAQHLLVLVLYQQRTMADLHLFAALCCLAERVFSIQLWPTLAGKEMIECVDFEALEWKLRGCTVEPSLYKLFTLL